jgi:hypothetical protein
MLAVGLAGCSEPNTSPIPNTLPTPDASATANRSVPAPNGTWTGLRTTCPTLSSKAAVSMGVNGPGRPTSDYTTNGPNVTADCQWGSTDGRGISATLRMSIYRTQAASDAAWQVLSAGQTEPANGIGDEAFTRVEPPAVTVRVRSNNVVAVVRLVMPAASVTVKALQQHRPVAEEITKDMLDDLR